MMKKNLRRRSNKGFTLTEVIIAVSILAIAATPLISNFVQSGTMNKKAREHLNAMNIAQDIMEGFSAYKGEDLMNKFESGKSLYGTVLPDGLHYGAHGDYDASGSVGYSVAVADDGTITAAGTPTYSSKVEPDDAGVNVSKKITINKAEPEYNFFINGLKQQKTTYDIDVKISYNDYKNTTGVDMNRMYEVKPKVDCTYSNLENIIEGEVDGEPAVKFAMTKFISASTNGATEEQLKGKMDHTITCEVKNNGDASNPDYAVLITDKYEVKDMYKNSLGLSNGTSSVYFYRTNDPIYDNGTIEKPRNVYIYYTGSAGTTKSNPLDTIELINTTGEEMNFYVIRQRRYEMDPINENYKCSLKITSTDADGHPNKLTKVVQNMRYDLSKDGSFDNLRYYKEDGTTIDDYGHLNLIKGLAKDTPFQASFTNYSKVRCDIYYNEPTLITEDDYVACINDGIMEDTTPPVYDVTITVYKAGSHRELAKYTGSLSGGTE